jgi:hypothetical protein
MEKRRIPQAIGKFSIYLANVKEHLSAIVPGTSISRGELLGMTPDEVLQLSSFLASWITGNPSNRGAYELHTDTRTKSRITRLTVVTIMQNFGKFFRPLLMRMSTSPNITIADRSVLNISEAVTTRTHHIVSIKEKPKVNLKMLGGGEVMIYCCNSDEGRYKKHPLAKAVEVAYVINNPWQAFTENKVDATGKPKFPVMKDPEEGTKKVISSKAVFIVKLKGAITGYHLQLMARWVNIKNPRLNGPWCSAIASTIL